MLFFPVDSINCIVCICYSLSGESTIIHLRKVDVQIYHLIVDNNYFVYLFVFLASLHWF